MTETTNAATRQLNLEFLKKQAKALVKEINGNNPAALDRLNAVHPHPAQPAKLADAQLVIAREHGFPSWPKFRAYVESTGGANAARFRAIETNIEYYDGRANGLKSQHESGLPSAISQIRAHHPQFRDASDEAIVGADFTIDDARLVTAIEHGRKSWREMKRWIDDLSQGETVEPFNEAFLALKSSDTALFSEWIRRDPTVVNASGTNANSMLSLAVSFRQVQALRLLLENGADVNAANVRGWTALHQAMGSNQKDVAVLLLDYGADPSLSALGDGGTPLVIALFWGNAEAADLLVQRTGVLPKNLRAAAGAGQMEMAAAFFDEAGELLPEAGMHRDHYRPHSGFPVWRPSGEPQEIIDEAFVYAASNGRLEMLEFLMEHGAGINSDPYRGSALHRVVKKPGLISTAKWLIDHGADVNLRATFGGPGYGEAVTPLHVAAEGGSVEMAKLLIEHGADASLAEDVYNATPTGWAEHFGHKELAEYLRCKHDS
jgi:ankyrin repeat protein